MNVKDIKIGEKIKLRSPGSQIPIVTCHIQAIIQDPANNSPEGQMIVYRYWSKYGKRWFWKVYPYWQLAMYNDWESDYLKQ
jgi:hypothetical protein